jgi:hypothetical protein
MQFTDAVTVEGKPRRTGDGYLVATAKSVRTGIQLYAGVEVGMADKAVVRVYRPPEEVFADASLQSFSHAPVTLDHPTYAVTADNWKDLAVGEVSTAAKKDGEWVHLPLILKDKDAIAAVEAGKRELSAGYVCELDWTPGVTADGQAYDAQQRNIKINHLALVDRARAGSQARIGDGAWGASPMIEDNQLGLAPITTEKDTMSDALKTVVLGDKAVQVAVADVAAIEQFKLDTAQALAKAKADHDKAIAAKDADLAKKDAEIDGLKAKVVDGAALDKLVADRAELCATVAKIAPKVETKGLSDADIRKAAVVAVRGADAVAGKSEAYVDAAFDILAADAVKTADSDPFRTTVQAGIKVNVGDAQAANDALNKSVDDLNSWRKEA